MTIIEVIITNIDCIECIDITSDLTASPRISATIVTRHVFNMSRSYCALRGIGAEGKSAGLPLLVGGTLHSLP